MRTKEEVLEKVEELRGKRLRERKKEYLSKCPRNCVHNEMLKVRGEGRIGFCQNPKVLNDVRQELFVCNDDETARKCRYFECRNTEESVEDDFDEILRSPSRCGRDYPKLAILIWCIQDVEKNSRQGRFVRAVQSFYRAAWRFLSFKWW